MGDKVSAPRDSILLGIERAAQAQTRTPPADRKLRWPWVLGCGLLAVVAIWLSTERPSADAPRAVVAATPAAAALESRSSNPTPPAAAPAPAAAPTASASQAAVLENLEAPAAPAPLARPTTVAAAATPARPAAGKREPRARADAPARRSTHAKAGSASAPTARTTRPPASRDPDTQLMAALIAATDRQPAPNSAAEAAARPAQLHSARTIAGLVRQCEGEPDRHAVRRCRNRICEGYWGKAQACPSAGAPAAQALSSKQPAGTD